MAPPAPRKLVVDWNNFPIGRVRDAQVDPRTRTVSGLVVALTEEARTRLRGDGPDLVIPVRYVYGVRRDQVTLDRTFEDLRRVGAAPLGAL